jgi:hypothetical protein
VQVSCTRTAVEMGTSTSRNTAGMSTPQLRGCRRASSTSAATRSRRRSSRASRWTSLTACEHHAAAAAANASNCQTHHGRQTMSRSRRRRSECGCATGTRARQRRACGLPPTTTSRESGTPCSRLPASRSSPTSRADGMRRPSLAVAEPAPPDELHLGSFVDTAVSFSTIPVQSYRSLKTDDAARRFGIILVNDAAAVLSSSFGAEGLPVPYCTH